MTSGHRPGDSVVVIGTDSQDERVVVRLALGAPPEALLVPIAPIAPDPFVPEGFTPLKDTTVIEESTLCDRVAVIGAPLTTAEAKGRQISAVPS